MQWDQHLVSVPLDICSSFSCGGGRRDVGRKLCQKMFSVSFDHCTRRAHSIWRSQIHLHDLIMKLGHVAWADGIDTIEERQDAKRLGSCRKQLPFSEKSSFDVCQKSDPTLKKAQ